MQKIKEFIESNKGKDMLVVIIVILVGIVSFELGRLSKESDSGGIKIEYPNGDQGANVTSAIDQNASKTSLVSTTISNKNFFASSKGSKYYTIGCSAGKTIKQENRVYFATGEEAEATGYTLSSSCN